MLAFDHTALGTMAAAAGLALFWHVAAGSRQQLSIQRPYKFTVAFATDAVYVYISNDQPAQNRDGGRGQQAGTQNPVQHVLGQVPLGRGDSAAARRSGDPWAARGRPRKLSEPN